MSFSDYLCSRNFVHIKIDVVVVEHTIAYIHPNSEIGLGFVEDAISEYRESSSASFTFFIILSERAVLAAAAMWASSLFGL